MDHVSISAGNSKMGGIRSVSLPSILTCRDCDCVKKCYAHKLERLRPTVRNAYQRNLEILASDPDTYWREVEAAIMMCCFFRFHVSGDIPNMEYLERMVNIARRQQHCEILCFTKRYEFVNEYLRAHGEPPKNLHLIFSGWPKLQMVNPYDLPEAHVQFKDGTTTAKEGAFVCSGNCAECAICEGGCWSLKKGEQVVFYEH